MDKPGIQCIDQLLRAAGQGLIGRVIDLCALWSIRVADGNAVAAVRKKQSVHKVRSFISGRCIEQTKLGTKEVGAWQTVIGRVITEHSWRIEEVLTQVV